MKGRVPAGNIKLKRAYDTPAPDDGMRILVDRLWPRGLSKQRAAIDQWMKDLSPSTKLRQWFGHDPSRWDEFRRRYGHTAFERAGPDGLARNARQVIENAKREA